MEVIIESTSKDSYEVSVNEWMKIICNSAWNIVSAHNGNYYYYHVSLYLYVL